MGATLVGWMFCVGILSPFVVSNITTQNQIPPQYRVDRWELSRDGQQALRRTEELCGPLPADGWIDMTEQDAQPAIHGVSEALEACFDQEVAPYFQRGRPVDI